MSEQPPEVICTVEIDADGRGLTVTVGADGFRVVGISTLWVTDRRLGAGVVTGPVGFWAPRTRTPT